MQQFYAADDIAQQTGLSRSQIYRHRAALCSRSQTDSPMRWPLEQTDAERLLAYIRKISRKLNATDARNEAATG